MLVISFRPAALFEQSGWWHLFTNPAEFTISNYKNLFAGPKGGTVPSGFAPGGALDSLRTSIEITVPATILVTLVSALSAYSLVFGRWRGRNFIFLTCVGLLVVPLQVAILPVVEGFDDMGKLDRLEPLRDDTGRGHFPCRFWVALWHLLDAQFLPGDPEGPGRGRPR